MTSQIREIILKVFVVLILISSVIIAVFFIRFRKIRARERRQLNIIKSRNSYAGGVKPTEGFTKYEKKSIFGNLDLIKNINKVLEIKLYRIGIRRNTVAITLVWVAGVVFIPSIIYAFSKSLKPTLVVLFLALISPFLVMNLIQKKRTESFENQLADAINVMQGAISSGRSFQDSLIVVAKSSEEPIKTEFNILFNEINLGTTMSDALENLANRVKSPDVNIFCTALIVQSSIGGNLILILENIADTIRTRNRLKKEIKAKTSSGRLSGIIVAVLPAIIFGFIRITDPAYITDFTDTIIGKVAFAVGILLMIIGAILIKRITDVRY